MTPKDTFNKVQLRNLKRASLKQKECELDLKIKEGADKETIFTLQKEIKKLKLEIKKLK